MILDPSLGCKNRDLNLSAPAEQPLEKLVEAVRKISKKLI
jgi:hypothetical protein